MDEREIKTVFSVEYTEYGWAVSINGRRVAMYPWHEEALAYAEAPSHNVKPKITDIAPALPDRPSIAVLPFGNIGAEPEQDYFADGVVEEIITALSRMRWLLVIARNSSFTYKGRSVEAKQIGHELGVRARQRSQGRAATAHHGAARRCANGRQYMG